jgi:hypothetical protein
MRRIFACITALSVLGCSAPTIATTVPPDLELGRLGQRTAFELGPPATPAPTPAPAPPGPPPAGDPGRQPAPDPPGPPPSAPPPGTPPDTEPTTSADAIPAGPAEASADRGPPGPMQPDAPLQDPAEPDKRQRARTGLFWTGIVLTAVGGGGTIAFAAVGEGTEDQLNRAYGDGSLTRARRSQLEDRGEIMNGLAIGSAALTLVGIALASIAYGVDYTRCGKLAKRRRKPCRQ